MKKHIGNIVCLGNNITVNWKASLVGQILVSFTGQVISRRTQLQTVETIISVSTVCQQYSHWVLLLSNYPFGDLQTTWVKYFIYFYFLQQVHYQQMNHLHQLVVQVYLSIT